MTCHCQWHQHAVFSGDLRTPRCVHTLSRTHRKQLHPPPCVAFTAAMSDDEEEEFVYDQDDEEQDEQNEQEVEAQNTYFGAKRHLSDGAFASAQASFESLLALEKAHPELHEWGFKAVKRLAKMHIAQGNFAAGLANFSCVPPLPPLRARAHTACTLLCPTSYLSLLRPAPPPPPPRPRRAACLPPPRAACCWSASPATQ